jgi:putative Mg2+ transporter-C (MgtC) family protein
MDGILDWLSSITQAYPGLRLDLLGRMVLALVLGSAIGWERERAQKPAGLRTNILICLGATLLADLSVKVAATASGPADAGRIAAQIVSGVGFLGAGTIIQSGGSVSGLTTAATLWVVAAIGLAVGIGATVEAVGTTILVLVALTPLRKLEARAEEEWRADAGSEGPDARRSDDAGST